MSAVVEPHTPVRLASEAVREQLMVQAAKLHFDLDRTKSEIASELGLTRWQVARLLKDARESGVVRIDILPHGGRRTDLEVALQKAFDLREAIVVTTAPGDEAATATAVARAAADYLASLAPKPELFGVSWGRTLASVAHWLAPLWNEGAHIVLVNGATNLRDAASRSHAVADDFASAARGRATNFPAPAIVGRAETRRVLDEDPVIAAVLELARAAPVVCFGLGALDQSIHVESGYVDTAAIARLKARGAVGDILGRFVDADGLIVDPELDARTLGLELSELAAKQRAIAVASGLRKHPVILAGLRAGYINSLVTDEAAARYVLGASGVNTP